MSIDATETALVVPVPAAEDAVGGYRSRLDPAAAWGVPAHLTVVYPFAPPVRVAALLPALEDAVRSVAAFDFTLARTAWFGSTVLWLAPEPSEPFRALTSAVERQFPEYPPYRGEFADVVPHLTVGDGGPEADLRAAEEALRPLLPIRARCTAVHLIAGTAAADSWRTVAELPLA
jgi:2'-5' RNA ligase